MEVSALVRPVTALMGAERTSGTSLHHRGQPAEADWKCPPYADGVDVSQQAAVLAARLLEPLDRRWRHVQAVAERAYKFAPAVDDVDRDTLTTAAWLHDIGYASEIACTGFHPLDGARFLRDKGWPPAVVNLVAHHSGARYEAVDRGLAEELAEFRFELNALQDALDTADLTTSPDGEPMTFAERMDEIAARYPPDDPVARFWPRARAVEAEAIERTMARKRSAVSVWLVTVVRVEVGRDYRDWRGGG
jgi:putative nucleotidyltransferase with HDIG domain